MPPHHHLALDVELLPKCPPTYTDYFASTSCAKQNYNQAETAPPSSPKAGCQNTYNLAAELQEDLALYHNDYWGVKWDDISSGRVKVINLAEVLVFALNECSAQRGFAFLRVYQLLVHVGLWLYGPTSSQRCSRFRFPFNLYAKVGLNVLMDEANAMRYITDRWQRKREREPLSGA
jgi:hypothetical protein